MSYSFHHQHHTNAGHSRDEGRAIVAEYLDNFQYRFTRPNFKIVSFGVCAGSEKRAHAIWSSFHGPKIHQIPGFLGPPKQCLEMFRETATAYNASELVIAYMCRSAKDRLASFSDFSQTVTNRQRARDYAPLAGVIRSPESRDPGDDVNGGHSTWVSHEHLILQRAEYSADPSLRGSAALTGSL